MKQQLLLLSEQESALRVERVRSSMQAIGLEAAFVRDFANLYYLTGRVFDGYIYLSVSPDISPVYFIKRPVHLIGEGIISITKPENMAETIVVKGKTIGLELDTLSFSAVQRLSKAFGGINFGNVSGALRQARAVKTPYELAMLRFDGVRHAEVYGRIPRLYREGMTDIELQVEIERESRLEGCLGQFRISGDTMELFMGNVLAGENADAPSPYDFAMGGAGPDPSCPVGADGTMIRPGMSVMVDMNGNFNGYMTDMTRTFGLGTLAAEALAAHKCSIDICHTLARMGKPGVKASDMYEKALEMAEQCGLRDYFMGHHQHAGFIGHGVGIEINELPVIAPRSRDVLQESNVIALEPKFVIPGTGAVGIENTYVVTDSGMETLTNAPEDIIYFPE